MPDYSTPAPTSRAFTEAWTSHDMDRAASYLTEDIVFDGPLGHVDGKSPYIASVKGVTQALDVTGTRVVGPCLAMTPRR